MITNKERGEIEWACYLLQKISEVHGEHGTEKYGENNYKLCAKRIYEICGKTVYSGKIPLKELLKK